MTILVFIGKYVKEILLTSISIFTYFLYKKNISLKEERNLLNKVIKEADSIAVLQRGVLKNIKDAKNINPSHDTTIKLMRDKKL